MSEFALEDDLHVQVRGGASPSACTRCSRRLARRLARSLAQPCAIALVHWVTQFLKAPYANAITVFRVQRLLVCHHLRALERHLAPPKPARRLCHTQHVERHSHASLLILAQRLRALCSGCWQWLQVHAKHDQIFACFSRPRAAHELVNIVRRTWLQQIIHPPGSCLCSGPDIAHLQTESPKKPDLFYGLVRGSLV